VDAALILTDKSKFRIWRDQIEPGPRWRTVDTWHMPDREPLPTPFILKPNRSSGGRGAGRVGSLSDLQSLWRSWDERTRQGGALAETWLEGNELSLEGFLRDGEFWFALVTSRRTAQVPYVATTGHRWPSGLSAEAEAETIESVAEICRRLGVNDGPVDADIIYTDAPQVLELSPRPGGNCLTHLVSSVLRVDYAEVAVNSALGSRPQGPSPSMRVGAAALDILHAFQPAVLSYDLGAVTAAMSGDGVALLEIDYPSGERVTSFRSGRDRIGAVIATGPTISQAEASIFHTLDCLDWRLEPVFTL
jgi:biotin carboxylase